MEIHVKHAILGIFAIFAFLAIPAPYAYAGAQSGYSVSMIGYHGGGHRIWDHYDSSHKNKYKYNNRRKFHHVKPRQHDHDYKTYGFTKSLPFGAKKIKVRDVAYRYHDGVFYKKCKNGYDLVRAPLGAYVRRLPPGNRVVYGYGKKYYVHNGNYYKKARSGYKIVTEPHFEVTYHKNRPDGHYSSHKWGSDCY